MALLALQFVAFKPGVQEILETIPNIKTSAEYYFILIL